jgi:hypothetical protein
VLQQAIALPEKIVCRERMLRYPQISVDKFVDYLGIASVTVGTPAKMLGAVKK